MRPHVSMHAFDRPVLVGVPLATVADALCTPVWVYGGTMRARLRGSQAVPAGRDPRGHYVLRGNDHRAVLSIFANGSA